MMTNFRGKMVPALRVRIPPPKQAAAACSRQPLNAAAGARPATVRQHSCGSATVRQQLLRCRCGSSTACRGGAGCCVDPELEPDPVKPIGEDLDDEIAF